MSIKKKMSMGIMAGALGVSLIGGGTWAAFNDVEVVDNSFTAGTLDLGTSTSVFFNLSNLKPGDTFSKTLVLTNEGSLEINDILLTTTENGWENVNHNHLPISGLNGLANGENTKEEFLSQFNVKISKDGTPVFGGVSDPKTLWDLVSLPTHDVTGSPTGVGLGIEASTTFVIDVEFHNKMDVYPGTRIQEQNKFQNEGASFEFKFEATQMPGEERTND